ncbi:MAG: nuclease-related domain-containing protein [Desulfobacteraceae bacterium]|jgi:hypothetical protein
MFEFNNHFMQLIIPAGIVAAVAILWIIATAGLRYSMNRKRRGAVLEGSAIRCRAQDCLIQLKVTNDYLKYFKMGLFIIPVLIVGAYLAAHYLAVTSGDWVEITGLAIFSLLLMLFTGLRLARLIGSRNMMRLVHESRLATRRVLDPLLKEKYRVFHDVVGDQFSIDHLVVGPKGVFAIQTHARSVSASKQSPDDRIVTYNGRELFFPKGRDHGIVENARMNAEKLSQWLTGQTEEPVAVRAIISLPGWTVRRTSSEGMPIINPKQFASLFEHIQPWQLPASIIESIERRLQQARPE